MKKIGPFEKKRKSLMDPIELTLDPAVPRGLVDPVLYPGLLTREAVDKDLELDVPLWLPVPVPLVPDRKDDHIDDVGNFQTGYIGTTTHVDATPIVARIARIWLTQGTHTYSYKVINTFGTNVTGSHPVTFIVDRLAPYETAGISPLPLTTPTGWPGALTEAFLTASGDKVDFGIPDYDAYDAQPGDTWELSLSSNGPVVATGNVFPDEVVSLTRAVAEVSEGSNQLYYRLRDAAGNISTQSLALQISIALQPAPVLAAPGIVDALTLTGFGDRLIDLPDAAKSSGMLVIIPTYSADRAQDNFYVRLTTTHGALQVGPYPLGGQPLPFNFHVPFSTLKAAYGNSTGKIALTVEYAVERGGVFHWVPMGSTIELDLDKVGPENPDEPELTNPNLPPPHLTGPTSAKDNELDATDALQDAPVTITLWSDPPLPSARPFDIVLYYAGEQVDRVTVDHTAAVPGQTVPMSVPWPFIQRHSNGEIPLHYELVTTGTNNRNVSPVQDITVAANVISFLAPSVVGAITPVPGVTLFGCSAVPAPARVLQVAVPPHPLMEAGMVINLKWNAFSDDAGTVPLPAASDVFPYGPLNPSELITGFNISVAPYDTYIKPINTASLTAGSVRITYEVPIPGTGAIDSVEAHVLVRAYLSGSTPTYCDGTTWP
ncbi:hypothetical protein ACW9H6_25440 [Pseudomonas sp. SDO528_S397]